MGFLLGCIRKLLLAVLPPVLRRLFIKSVQIFESLYKFLSMELGPHILKQSLREITLPGKLTT